MIPVNPILAIDAYKFGHMAMHPHEISGVYGNFTPRRMEYINRMIPEQFRDNKLVSFGEEMAIKDITDSFKNNFFNRPLDEVIDEYMFFAAPFIGENEEAAAVLRQNITNLHNLGYLPLIIKALPQGTITNPQVPTITSRETVPGFGWLPQYLETYISQSTWKTSTVATMARAYRRIYEHYADLTCDDNSHIIFQGHDFSARGMSSTEDSIKCGIAHLTQFWGSDSVHAAYSASKHYGYKNDLPLAFSVPATESDAGANKKIQACSSVLDIPFIRADKLRSTTDNSLSETIVYTTAEELDGKTLLIVDDICDGGRTFAALAQAIKKIQPNCTINLFITHGFFTYGIDHLYEAGISKITSSTSVSHYHNIPESDTFKLQEFRVF